MITVRALHREHKRLKPLIDLAVQEGWRVASTPGGHLRFFKQGLPPIFTGATAKHPLELERGYAAADGEPRGRTSEVGADD